MIPGSVLVLGAVLLLVTSAHNARARLGLQADRRAVRPADAAAVLLAAGVLVLVGGLRGVVLSASAGLATSVLLRRLVTAQRREERAVARQAADAVDCLAACLRAGAPVWAALPVVADAFGGPMGAVLSRVVNRHAMGAAHRDTFAELLDTDALAPLGRVLLRSVESGASLSRSLGACAEQMREQHSAHLQQRARRVGVAAVGPLAGCFLPAFVLLAVVPIIGSLVLGLF